MKCLKTDGALALEQNIMFADGLVTQSVKAPAAMILTEFIWNISVVQAGLIWFG